MWWIRNAQREFHYNLHNLSLGFCDVLRLHSHCDLANVFHHNPPPVTSTGDTVTIVFVSPDSNSKPKVECSVVTEFTDHICVTMDAELIMFLHDLVSAYLKEKEKGLFCLLMTVAQSLSERGKQHKVISSIDKLISWVIRSRCGNANSII